MTTRKKAPPRTASHLTHPLHPRDRFRPGWGRRPDTGRGRTSSLTTDKPTGDRPPPRRFEAGGGSIKAGRGDVSSRYVERTLRPTCGAPRHPEDRREPDDTPRRDSRPGGPRPAARAPAARL